MAAEVTAPDGRRGCAYCAERLRVNVGLVEENRQLRGKVGDAVLDAPEREAVADFLGELLEMRRCLPQEFPMSHWRPDALELVEAAQAKLAEAGGEG